MLCVTGTVFQQLGTPIVLLVCYFRGLELLEVKQCNVFFPYHCQAAFSPQLYLAIPAQFCTLTCRDEV